MDWKQIETKWAEMARRIRADVDCGMPDGSAALRRRSDKHEIVERTRADQIVVVATEVPQDRDPASTH